MQARVSHIAYFMLFVLALSSLACAGIQKESDKRRFIERETSRHVYDQPLTTIMPHARKILFREGFQVRDTSETVMETEYLTRGRYDDRYLVTATESANGWRVEFTLDRVNKAANRADSERDITMEWELLKAADPSTARRIDREAEAYANSRN